jgi:hypothetical protein
VQGATAVKYGGLIVTLVWLKLLRFFKPEISMVCATVFLSFSLALFVVLRLLFISVVELKSEEVLMLILTE